ncbi:MAG: hypothetical protein RLZZ196_2767 [Bacteroidota bacterium]|jgi:hypothetical protein
MGIISRLLGKEGPVITSNVDDFIKAGRSVKSNETRSLVAQISQTLRDMDFENLAIEFQGQDTAKAGSKLTTIGRRITGAELARHTLAGVFTDQSLKDFGLGDISGGTAFHRAIVPGTKDHIEMIDFFRSQGIKIENPDDIKSVLIFNNEAINSSLPDNLLLVGHETRTCC